MGITALDCGHDLCKAIALLDKWKDYANIADGTLDYLRMIANDAIGKECVEYELTRQGVKVE